MERNTNALTILVGLIFLLLLVFFLFRFIFASPVGNFGSSIVYGQKTTCKDSNVEAVEGQASKGVKVYTNGATHNIDVTGDIIVKKNTCTVRVVYGPRANDFYEITPDNRKDSKDSRTVTVARNQEMKIHCRVTDKKDKCEWKYSRSSP